MTLIDLIAALDVRGVRLTARLAVDAPAGVLTPELREALADHKSRLLAHVVREMVWAELSTWRWGPARHDPEPGIINDRPDDTWTLATRQAASADPTPSRSGWPSKRGKSTRFAEAMLLLAAAPG
jgi:hypothetical protein